MSSQYLFAINSQNVNIVKLKRPTITNKNMFDINNKNVNNRKLAQLKTVCRPEKVYYIMQNVKCYIICCTLTIHSRNCL